MTRACGISVCDGGLEGAGHGPGCQLATKMLVSPRTLPPRLLCEGEAAAVGRKRSKPSKSGLKRDAFQIGAIGVHGPDIELAPSGVSVV